jgi:hypothetical protein
MARPHRLLALAVVAVLSAGCDAGSSTSPANDNRWPGPELTIVQPGPGLVVRRAAGSEIAVDEQGATRRDEQGRIAHRITAWQMPKALIDVRRPARPADHEGDRILWRLDGGPFQTVGIEQARKGFELDALGAHAPGTHLLQACVVDATGAPYPNSEAAAACVFHLHAESGALDRFEAEGVTPLVPRVSSTPTLLVTGPRGTMATPRLAFAVSGARLGDGTWRVAYRLDRKGEWIALEQAGAHPLEGLAPGDHVIDVRLERRDGTTWVPASRPRSAYLVKDGELVPSDEPVDGEIDFVRNAFTVGG